MDKRQKKTRMAIFNALIELLKHKNYNNISVQDIVDEAIIGRSTFYIHFETKDALLKEYCDEFFNHIITYTKADDENRKYIYTDNNPYNSVTHMLYHLKADKRTIVTVLMSECEEMIFNIFKAYIGEIFDLKINEGIKNGKISIPNELIVNHITSSFINVVKWWTNEGMLQKTEEISDYFKNLIEPIFE